jgi:hypothetical protein
MLELEGMLASVELLLKAASASSELLSEGAGIKLDSIVKLAEDLKSKGHLSRSDLIIETLPLQTRRTGAISALSDRGGAERYRELLSLSMADGDLVAAESAHLAAARQKYGISTAQHDKMLATMGKGEGTPVTAAVDVRVHKRMSTDALEFSTIQAAEIALLATKGGKEAEDPAEDDLNENATTEETHKSKKSQLKSSQSVVKGLKEVQMLAEIKMASTAEMDNIDGREMPTIGAADWSSSNRLKLDEKELTLANEAFSAIDVNGDGRLSPEEIFSVLSCLGIRPTVQELYALMREFDDNDDGNLGLPEFIALISTVKKRMNGTTGKKNVIESLTNMTELMTKIHQESSEGDYIGNSPYILHPNHPLQGVWDLMISVLLGITMITIPLTLAFQGFSARSLHMNVVIDFIFCLDIIKNFNSGTINSDDVVILDRKLIARQYFFSWFFLDLFSSIPLELFLSGGDSSSNGGGDSTQYARTTKSMKLLRLLKLAKLLRLLKVNRVFWVLRTISQIFSDRIGVTLQMKATWNLCRLFIQLLLIAHWVGCLNFMLCRLYDFPEESWVSRLDIRHASNSEQWSWSFYKALSYMIGVGLDTGGVSVNCMTYYEALDMDVRKPSSWCEVENWNILVCLYVGAVFCALLISEVSSIIISVNAKGQAVQDLLHKANDYMRAKRLPVATRDKVRKFLYSEYNTDKILYSEEELLNMLPETLVTEILTFKTRDVVEACPLLKEHSKGFQASVSNAIRPHIAFIDDAVFEENTSGQSIYFINSGVVQIVTKGPWDTPSDSTTVCAVLSNGCYFGDVGCFFNIKRTAGAVAITLCNLYSVDQQELFKLLDDFPTERDYMINIAASRLKRMDDIHDGKQPDKVDGDEHGVLKVVDEEDKKTELLRIGSLLGKYEQVLGEISNIESCPVVVRQRKAENMESMMTINNKHKALHAGLSSRPGTPGALSPLSRNDAKRELSTQKPGGRRKSQRRKSLTQQMIGAVNGAANAVTNAGLGQMNRRESHQVHATNVGDSIDFHEKRQEIEALARREFRRQSIVLEDGDGE